MDEAKVTVASLMEELRRWPDYYVVRAYEGEPGSVIVIEDPITNREVKILETD